MINDFEEFNEEGLYYVYSSFKPNHVLTIKDNGIESYKPLTISIFEDSFNQAFYFLKNEDNSYFIMNINSLKILGVEGNYNNSPIIQNIISPSNNYKWEIIKTNNYFSKEYYIGLKYNNKRIYFQNQFAVIKDSNNYSQSHSFMFRKCLYNVIKSDLWQKWEKFYYREFIENQIYVIRSSENDNNVINLDLYNNITLRYFNGNQEQIFFIFKVNNCFHIVPFNFINIIKKNSINEGTFSNLNRTLLNLQINREFCDNNGIPLYSISNKSGTNLNISPYNSLEFNYSYGNTIKKFYFSLVTSVVFKRYILKTLNDIKLGENIILKYENILDYDLDGFRNIKYLSINENTKYISDNEFKKTK